MNVLEEEYGSDRRGHRLDGDDFVRDQVRENPPQNGEDVLGIDAGIRRERVLMELPPHIHELVLEEHRHHLLGVWLVDAFQKPVPLLDQLPSVAVVLNALSSCLSQHVSLFHNPFFPSPDANF